MGQWITTQKVGWRSSNEFHEHVGYYIWVLVCALKCVPSKWQNNWTNRKMNINLNGNITSWAFAWARKRTHARSYENAHKIVQCSNCIVALSKAFKYKQTLPKVRPKRLLYYFHIIMYYFEYISIEISICSAFIHWLRKNNVIMVVFVFSTSSSVCINLAHTLRKRVIFLRRE